MSSSLQTVTSRTDQPPLTRSNSTQKPDSPINTGVKPKDTLQSMQGKRSSDCCLAWCWNKICAFFSAIGRGICSLFGRTSQEPSPSTTSTTPLKQPSTTTPEPTPLPQTPEPEATDIPEPPPIQPIIHHPKLPPPPKLVKTKSLREPTTIPEKRAREVNDALPGFPADICKLISAFDFDGVWDDFPFKSEWAHELLKKFEEGVTLNNSYTGLRDLHYMDLFLKYNLLQKWQFVYELTHTEREPKRAFIDYITLGNFVNRLASDPSGLMQLLQDREDLCRPMPVKEIHESIHNHLDKHYFSD